MPCDAEASSVVRNGKKETKKKEKKIDPGYHAMLSEAGECMYRKQNVILMLLYPGLWSSGLPAAAQVIRVLLLVDLDRGKWRLFAHRLDGGRGEGDERQELSGSGADGGVEGDVLE